MPELADLDFEHGDGGEVRARLHGELDMEGTDAIRARLGEAITSDVTTLVVDLSAVTFMDSSGVELLFRLRSELAVRQMGLRLVLPEGSLIRRTLEVTDGGTELLELVSG